MMTIIFQQFMIQVTTLWNVLGNFKSDYQGYIYFTRQHHLSQSHTAASHNGWLQVPAYMNLYTNACIAYKSHYCSIT